MDPRARHFAQQRVKRIRAFRDELAELQREQALVLSPEQRARLEAHQEGVLSQLAEQFNVDVNEAGRRMSWGMRVAAVLGGASFLAALVLFLHRIWGMLGPTSQSLILTVAPLLGLAAAEFTFRRQKDLFFVFLVVLATGVAFVMELNALGSTFNMYPRASTLLAWGSFAVLVAHAYGLRLVLGAGLLLLITYVGGMLIQLEGGYWADIFDRPESLLPGAILVYGAPALVGRRDDRDFPFVYRLSGAAMTLLGVLVLSDSGSTSHLPFRASTVEALYQVVGLVLSSGVVWHGIRLGRGGLVNLGALFFVVFLYIRLHAWWWDWMPKSLFFLLIGLMALVLIVLFRRLHSRVTERRIA